MLTLMEIPNKQSFIAKLHVFHNGTVVKQKPVVTSYTMYRVSLECRDPELHVSRFHDLLRVKGCLLELLVFDASHYRRQHIIVIADGLQSIRVIRVNRHNFSSQRGVEK